VVQKWVRSIKNGVYEFLLPESEIDNTWMEFKAGLVALTKYINENY